MTHEQLEQLLAPYWQEKITYRNIDVDPGWYYIIERCHNELKAVAPDYRIIQIKQKFGQLRYYIDKTDSVVDEIIYKHELMSSSSCETCSAPAELTNFKYRYKTLCSFHSKDFSSHE